LCDPAIHARILHHDEGLNIPNIVERLPGMEKRCMFLD
jgi:hypothetical protein